MPNPSTKSSSSGSGLRTTSAKSPIPSPTETEKENKKEVKVIDAGLRSLDHYQRTLPRWRHSLRKALLPLIRWETPYLAYLQRATRTPALDSYFAITANLGTHTFFMIFLPILFWFGFVGFAKGLIHILASGVFFTGFIKDMVSLPRPLSPPLRRITMSESVALEYGFPSTHSTNAVSVAVYGALMLRDADLDPRIKLALESLGYFYAASIAIGRLYCGMHGFVDVIVGSAMGALISWIEFFYGPPLDLYMQQSGWRAPLLAALTVIVLVRIHPEPADDCPCFDDSVAFAGTVIGVEIGTWHLSRSQYAWPLDQAPYPLTELGWPSAVARILVGVFIVFAWREVTKPTLLRVLPQVFRIIENLGLNLPRRFFVQASQYGNIPGVRDLKTDNVLPGVGDFPGIIHNIRNARRGRSVSIGPQSAADAYETLAYRERRRRESMGSQSGNGGAVSGGVRASIEEGSEPAVASASGAWRSPFAQYEEQMGQGVVIESPVQQAQSQREGSAHGWDGADSEEPDLFVGRQDDLGEKEIFEKLTRPRVRYDVEVVTKLIVYTGIGALAVEIIPVLYEHIGLGVGHLRP